MSNSESCSTSKYYILHLADIHIRDGGRAKFQSAIERLKTFIGNLPTTRRIIAVIAGDIFHYKTRLSAENIVDCYTLLDCLAARASDIIIIPGNHDANLNNESRVDLLTPIMTNCRELPNECQLHYWPKSGWADVLYDELQFYVFSPLSKPCAPLLPPLHMTRPAADSPVKIALVHDFVDGLRIQGSGGHGPILQEWLEDFDCVMCGHAHDYQAFGKIVYSGAFTQLTISESFDKGFVLWDIGDESISHRFVYLDIAGALVKYTITGAAGTTAAAASSSAVAAPLPRVQINTVQGHEIPKDAGRVVIEIRSQSVSGSQEVKSLVESVRKVCHAPIEYATSADMVATEVSQKLTSGSSSQVQIELIESKLRAANPHIDTATLQAVTTLHIDTMRHVLNEELPAGNLGSISKWSLISLSWSNLFCYGENNHIDFTSIHGLAGLIAPNRCGKSAVIDILVLALFNETLRGSAYSIIRRGCKEGVLRCVWDAETDMSALEAANASAGASAPRGTGGTGGPGEPIIKNVQHELIRKWDLKGHTVIKYIVDGKNFTGIDLKSTYASVSRSVGTIEDFLAAVLIPQHSDESFLDATDMRRRGIIARILGLDLLDAALSYIKEREKEHQGAIRALSTVIETATVRMGAIRHATKSAPSSNAAIASSVVKDLLDTDAVSVENDYQMQIAKARQFVQSIKDKLEALESAPVVARPAKTVDGIEREISGTRTKIEQLRSEIRAAEEKIANLRENLAILLKEIPGAKTITMDALDADRARLKQMTDKLDQGALLLSRAKGSKIEEVPARIEQAKKRLEGLLDIKKIVTEWVELHKFRAKDSAHAQLVTIAAAAFNALHAADKYDLPKSAEEAKTRRERLSIDKTLPATCRCTEQRSAEDRRILLDTLTRQAFAAGVKLPANMPTNVEGCIQQIRNLLASTDANTTKLHGAVLDIANHAIQAVRASAGTKTYSDLSARLEVAQYCAQFHDRIRTNNMINTEIVYLATLEEQFNIAARIARKEALRVSLDAILKSQKDILVDLPGPAASSASACAGAGAPAPASAPAHVAVPTLKIIDEQIFNCERALSLFNDLQQKAAQIREAVAIDAEITTLRSKIDTCFSIQRLTLALDNDVRAVDGTRARISELESAIKSLEARIEPTRAEQREYDEFVARQTEIKTLRADYARNQTAYLSLISEASEYARMREDLKDANRRIAAEHQAFHICQLYKMTLDTKTGIQYNLMTNAIGLIEKEANKLLEPIAGLKLCIQFGSSSTTTSGTREIEGIGDASDLSAALAVAPPVVPKVAHGTVTRTIQVIVRDSRTGIEHPAELCSGFQRFILNIALRRAFLRSSVRPMPQFMIIDEGFGCLDDANLATVCEHLPELSRELKFMLIVSHIDSLNLTIVTPVPIEIDVHGGFCRGSISSLRFGTMSQTMADVLNEHGIGNTPAKKSASSASSASAADGAPKTQKRAHAHAGASKSKTAGGSSASVPLYDPAVVDKRTDGTLFCKLCCIDFKIWSRHIKTVKHMQHVTKQIIMSDGAAKK